MVEVHRKSIKRQEYTYVPRIYTFFFLWNYTCSLYTCSLYTCSLLFKFLVNL